MIEPIWLLKYLPNMLACHISILIDCQGPSNTITEADASANLAIAEAARIIGRGRADVMIAGRRRLEDPPALPGADGPAREHVAVERASRRGRAGRSTADRDGWVPGEGAGILILEEREHALTRGARIYGEVLGGGSGCDAMPGGGLDPEGIGTEVAIAAALEDAGLDPSDIGHVNAHGSATRVSDLAEARALQRIFGAGGVPVTALKGYMGNLVSGCGSVELIASLVGANRGLIPPILNCDEPDPEIDADLVLGSPRPCRQPDFREDEPDPPGPGGRAGDPRLSA